MEKESHEGRGVTMNEKVLNQEERIRRAEEIYYRRKNQYPKRSELTTLNISQKHDFNLFKKMILQIIMCLFIYLIFFAIQNSNYIFSEQVKNKTKEVLSYDINLELLKNELINYYNKFKNFSGFVGMQEENILQNDVLSENIEIENTVEEQNEVNEQEDVLYIEEASSISQVEEDANYIKDTYPFIKPLERKNHITFWFKKSNHAIST